MFCLTWLLFVQLSTKQLLLILSFQSFDWLREFHYKLSLVTIESKEVLDACIKIMVEVHMRKNKVWSFLYISNIQTSQQAIDPLWNSGRTFADRTQVSCWFFHCIAIVHNEKTNMWSLFLKLPLN